MGIVCRLGTIIYFNYEAIAMFRRTHLLILSSCLLLSPLTFAQKPGRVDAHPGSGLAGKWEIPLAGPGNNMVRPMSINVQGDTFTGYISQFPIVDGKIKGNE